jgi:hypothetical protein
MKAKFIVTVIVEVTHDGKAPSKKAVKEFFTNLFATQVEVSDDLKGMQFNGKVRAVDID